MLTIDNLTCNSVLQGLNLSLAKGEIGAIMGNNGVGKSTLLKAIAGFVSIDQGSICFDGDVLSTPDWLQDPAKRSVGMVFQEMALFPHLNAEDNLMFGLQNESKQNKQAKLKEVCQLLHAGHLLDKYPYELSGGEQQRIAIGRTLVTGKPLMLFDEPFAKLDVSLKRELSFSVREHLKKLNITAVFVSHDKAEAINMCDKLGSLDKGNLSSLQDKRDLAVGMMDLLP